MDALKRDYPWTKTPLIVGAPMRGASYAPFATGVSDAGGFGFVAGGEDATNLKTHLEEVKNRIAKSENLSQYNDVLPVGIGFLVWAGQKLIEVALPLIETYRPAAVWLFGASNTAELFQWAQEVRRVTKGASKIWIQIGSVQQAVEYVHTCHPDCLVVQGVDAGGHGLMRGSGIVPLFPEVDDAISTLCQTENIKKPELIAAGGILDGRCAAAAFAMGASGICMGTRFLGSSEVSISTGYANAIIRSSDGGQKTERTHLYDQLRGTPGWPEQYGGRGILNESYRDFMDGMSFEENQRKYQEALKQGDKGFTENARLTTYAGTGIGLVNHVQSAAEITKEVRRDTKAILQASWSMMEA